MDFAKLQDNAKFMREWTEGQTVTVTMGADAAGVLIAALHWARTDPIFSLGGVEEYLTAIRDTLIANVARGNERAAEILRGGVKPVAPNVTGSYAPVEPTPSPAKPTAEPKLDVPPPDIATQQAAP